MSVVDGLFASGVGDYVAILGMVAATYACRAGGFLFMARVRVTPRIERALKALPGSIVVATILPIAASSGAPALMGLAAAVAVMAATRVELVGVVTGLGVVAIARALGL